ncbi:MAG: formylglycine-generating enzyme family protein [bacterium]
MKTFVTLLIVSLCSSALASEPSKVRIQGGEYAPFYPKKDGEIETVSTFEMDVRPVTNAQFLSFVSAHPKWQRTQVKRLFADAGYLGHWPEDLDVSGQEDQPVTRVSWFAARAYCQSQGGRLPTEHEWEFVARADATHVDATSDLRFNQKVLEFYGKPFRGQLDNVGQNPPNYWGLQDLHGIVWEWVEDFNASIISSDSRQTSDKQEANFCGGAALTAANTRAYATFMRFAFRSSLKASYTLRNLGFRCAYDPTPE